MDDDHTIPSRAPGLPVKAIRLEVVRGPDRGLVYHAGREVVSVGTAAGNDLVLTDPTVSRYHLELCRRADRIVVRDHGSTNGTLVGAVLLQDQTASVTAGTVVDVGQTSLRLDDGGTVLLELRGAEALGELRGRSPLMQRLMALIERLAATDVPVMVLGESGTGKELVARAVHEVGPRAQAPFVTLDCGALSPTLFQSELFGHERGAFTGADRRHVGAFERAQGGTLFLDEIGELPAALQVALLGALERRHIRRVGGQEDLSIDVRFICATNRDLRAEVNAGTFRLDLYYRLAVVLVQVPPLRERIEDIPLLVEHFARAAGHAGSIDRLFPPPMMPELQAQRWPGNVRELRNVVEATLALGHDAGPPGETAASPPGGASTPDVIAGALSLTYREARGAVLQEFEARYLKHLLARTQGRVRQAARIARMDRSYLTDLLRRHGLA